MSSIHPLELKELLKEAKKEDLNVIKERFREYYEDVRDTVFSVLSRALFTVERYAQVYCVDLSDRGLTTDMVSKVEKLDNGVRLTIDFIPKEEVILEAFKSPEFRKVIRHMERELKRIKKGRIYGGS